MLTLATNPIPIKAAMAMMDMAPEELRLPMTPLDPDKRAILRKTLLNYGLIE
jgi:4-hydroxy-tetrahydrodipicolinate synthase